MKAWVMPTLYPAKPSRDGLLPPGPQERIRGSGRTARERGENASDPRRGRCRRAIGSRRVLPPVGLGEKGALYNGSRGLEEPARPGGQPPRADRYGSERARRGNRAAPGPAAPIWLSSRGPSAAGPEEVYGSRRWG